LGHDVRVRLAELTGTLSFAADAGTGFPEDHGLRTAILAARLGASLGASSDECRAAYYLALLRYAGCTADAELASGVFGDEVEFGRETYGIDYGNPREVVPALMRSARRGKGRVGGAVAMARTFGRIMGLGGMKRSHCEVADLLATRLGFDAPFRAALVQQSERWDGKGMPEKTAAESIAITMRIAQLAEDIEVGHRLGGVDGACVRTAKLARGSLDPKLVQHFAARASEICAAVEVPSVWEAALAAEPSPHQEIADEALDDALAAVASFADLKSKYTRGHSAAVAELASGGARQMRLGAAAERDVRRAGLLHDIGRVAVSAGLWDKPGPLTDVEREKIRMHTYVGERVLACATSLASVAEIATLAHERLDGTGYHRRLSAASCPPAARLLAASDVYRALVEERPHRPARSADAAAAEISRMAAAGSLCPDASRAVLEAAGHASPRVVRASGLTDREVEVLRLLARGLTNKEIASALDISTKTAGHHVQHVFEKLGVTTRSAAAVCAMHSGVIA